MKVNLDLSGVNVMGSRVVLPTGKYNVEVVSAEGKENKAKTGGFIEVGFKVVDGDQAGTVVMNRYNIANQNQDAVKIGLAEIKTILTRGGHSNPDKLVDTNDMVGLKLAIYLEEEDHTFTADNGDEVKTTQNKFKAYFEFDNNVVQGNFKKEEKVSNAPKEEVKAETSTEQSAPAAAGGFPWGK